MRRRSSSRSQSRSRRVNRKRQSKRADANIVHLSANTKTRDETSVSVRRDGKTAIRTELAAVARVTDDDKTTVVRFALPDKVPHRSTSRRSRTRNRSRSRSRFEEGMELPVTLVGESSSREQLGVRVGGHPAVIDHKQNSIETKDFLISVLKVNDTDKSTVIEVVMARKPQATHAKGFFARNWKHSAIKILIAIVCLILGYKVGANAKPCIVNYTEGFATTGGIPTAVMEIVTPVLSLIPTGFRFANLQVLSVPSIFALWASSVPLPTLSLPDLSKYINLPQIQQISLPVPVASTNNSQVQTPTVVYVTKYLAVYNTKQELAKRELELLFSDAATNALHTEINHLGTNVSGLQSTVMDLQRNVSRLQRSNEQQNSTISALQGSAMSLLESTNTLQEQIHNLKENVTKKDNQIVGQNRNIAGLKNIVFRQIDMVTDLRGTVSELQGNNTQQTTQISQLQTNVTLLDEKVLLLGQNVTDFTVMNAKQAGTISLLEAKVDSVVNLQALYDELQTEFDSLNVTSAADVEFARSRQFEAEDKVTKYKQIIVPKLKSDIKVLENINKTADKLAKENEKVWNLDKVRADRAETALLKLVREQDIGSNELEAAYSLVLAENAIANSRDADRYALGTAIDSIVFRVRGMGLALPTTAEEEEGLRSALAKYTQDLGFTSDKVMDSQMKSLAFHDGMIARIELMLKGINDVRSALGAQYLQKMLREHKNQRRIVLRGIEDRKAHQKKEAGLQLAAATNNQYVQGLYITQRAADRSLTEMVTPMIVAERRPDGSYIIKDDVENLLKVAPHLRSSIDQLRSCLLDKLNGGNKKMTPQSISCTSSTRIALVTGSIDSSRDFNMNLMRKSNLAGGAAPIQRFEFAIQEKESPQIVTQIQYKTVTVSEKTVETVVTTTTATQTFSDVTTQSPATPTPIAKLLSFPPSLTVDVRNRVAAALETGTTKVVSRTSVSRTSATPFVTPTTVPDGLVTMSQGTDGAGTFLMEVKRTAVDVCDRTHPLSEYFNLLDTCKLNEDNELQFVPEPKPGSTGLFGVDWTAFDEDKPEPGSTGLFGVDWTVFDEDLPAPVPESKPKVVAKQQPVIVRKPQRASLPPAKQPQKLVDPPAKTYRGWLDYIRGNNPEAAVAA